MGNRALPVGGSPAVLCAGLLALDVIPGKEVLGLPRYMAAGGSAGNVAAVLRFFGTSSAIAARLGMDRAGEVLRDELSSLGIGIEGLQWDRSPLTAIVVEYLTHDMFGYPKHRFDHVCPICKNWFPRFRSITRDHVANLRATTKAPKVFYFDRATPAHIELAKWTRAT